MRGKTRKYKVKIVFYEKLRAKNIERAWKNAKDKFEVDGAIIERIEETG